MYKNTYHSIVKALRAEIFVDVLWINTEFDLYPWLLGVFYRKDLAGYHHSNLEQSGKVGYILQSIALIHRRINSQKVVQYVYF